ncbi:MAG: PEP-CTERM sorting domain-containing protein, partial [Syntrophorhabdus sp.]
MKKLLLKGLIIGVSILMLSGVISSVNAMGLLPGPKPPRGGGGGGGGGPSAVPEPSTLALLGAGA